MKESNIAFLIAPSDTRLAASKIGGKLITKNFFMKLKAWEDNSTACKKIQDMLG